MTRRWMPSGRQSGEEVVETATSSVVGMTRTYGRQNIGREEPAKI